MKDDTKTSQDFSEDLTHQQNEENYWKQTKETKIDGSVMAMEKRISTCQELNSGKSREACSNEVKTRMEKEGSSIVNTSDMKEDQKPKDEEEEVDEEEEEVEKKKKDTVDICPKKLAMLEEKAKKLDLIEKERETEKVELKKVVDMYETIKKERDAEKEAKRQEKIKQISTDFYMTPEELKNDSMESLITLERRLGLALKKANAEDNAEDLKEITEDVESDFQKQVSALKQRYLIKTVK